MEIKDKEKEIFKFSFKNRDILELAKLIITLSKTKNDYMLIKKSLEKEKWK